jgi:hypothetical protein
MVLSSLSLLFQAVLLDNGILSLDQLYLGFRHDPAPPDYVMPATIHRDLSVLGNVAKID